MCASRSSTWSSQLAVDRGAASDAPPSDAVPPDPSSDVATSSAVIPTIPAT